MKKIIFIALTFLSLSATGQFSESFFERMGPTTGKIGHFFGTALPNGALAVRFADSVNTEVQFAKLDLQGNYQTFSANLPNDYISPNERIIELYEIGTKQFIVTQDSASNNQEGIRVYRYNNYTQSDGVFELPVQLRNAYFQSYYKFGKIYVFFVESGVGMRRLKIDPTTLALEENLFLGALGYETQSINKHYKLTHVLFEDENNMQVFISNPSINRIKIQNNIPQALEILNAGITKIVGVNSSNSQIICVRSGQYNVRKYALNFSQTLSEIVLVDSLALEPESQAPSYEWLYANDGGQNEHFVFQRDHFQLQNNTLLGHRYIDLNCVYANLTYLGGKPLFAVKRYSDPDFVMWGLSNEPLDNLLHFNEYVGVYQFGDQAVMYGIGTAFSYYLNNDHFSNNLLFSKLLYSGSSYIIGKSNDKYYGVSYTNDLFAFKPGPFTNPSNYNHDIIHAFNESFQVSREMVNQHVWRVSINDPSYVIPDGILHWPAHGEVNLGQAENLAPFIDLNQNGIYEPQLGEYPSFPGTHCLLNISHQAEISSDFHGSGLELHSYLYLMECNDTLDEVLFYRTEVYNRSTRTYDSLAFGVYSDFDLGNYSDDYIGTHVENGLVYCYNADAYDDDYNGLPGFHDSLPTIAAQFLKGIKTPPNGIDDLEGIYDNQTVNGYGYNDAVIDNEFKGLEFSIYPTNTSPLDSAEFFNLLHCKDENGTPLYQLNGNMPERFVFPGTTDTLLYGTGGFDPGFIWNEISDNNPQGDRRIIGSFGSQSMVPGEKLVYDFAYMAGKRIAGTGQSQIDLFAKAEHVKNAFNNNLTSCGQTFDNLQPEDVNALNEATTESSYVIFPNPFEESFMVMSQQKGQITWKLVDIRGQLLQQGENTNEQFLVQTSHLKDGIYLLILEQNGRQSIQKVLKR